MSEGVIGLIGVAVGAFLTGGFELLRERSKDRRRARASARLLYQALSEIAAQLTIAGAQGKWFTDPQGLFSPQPWREHRGTLAEAPGFDGWEPVARAWVSIELMRQHVAETGEKSEDPPLQGSHPKFLIDGLSEIKLAAVVLLSYAGDDTYDGPYRIVDPDPPAADS